MKQLKNFGLFLVLAVCSLCTISCGGYTVEEMVEMTNAKCPMQQSEGLTIEKVTYVDNVVEYHMTIDENVLEIEADDEVIANLKEDLLKLFKKSYKEDLLLKAIVEKDLTLKYSYTGNITGESYEISVRGSEVK